MLTCLSSDVTSAAPRVVNEPYHWETYTTANIAVEAFIIHYTSSAPSISTLKILMLKESAPPLLNLLSPNKRWVALFSQSVSEGFNEDLTQALHRNLGFCWVFFPFTCSPYGICLRIVLSFILIASSPLSQYSRYKRFSGPVSGIINVHSECVSGICDENVNGHL